MSDTAVIDQGASALKANVTKIMEKAFLDYSMSVITDRALPDARDGLKPVHRRILYAMKLAGNVSGKPYRKSARTVGDVIGKFHPHGDASVYMAAVRMAQDFSLRVPLIDGQGNFGSIDDDPPAAMRYTEMRLSKIATECFFGELNSNGVDFRPNYDDTEKEPVVLPVSFPNLIVNGVEGIAVGMASSILPHNLSEVIRVTRELIKNPEMTTQQIMSIMPGPDFPTGGVIVDRSGFVEAVEKGRGRIKLRATWHEEPASRGATAIIIDSLPYQTIKTKVIEQIVNLVKNKVVEDITDLRDESNKEGVRIYIQLKRGADANVVMANLFDKTDLEKSFTYNAVALDGGIRPRQMGLRELILAWISFRREVIVRRLEHERGQLEKRLHILQGLLKALDNLDEVVKTIRNSKTKDEARVALEALLDIDEVQAKAILDMRLHQLTSLEADALREEHDNCVARIQEINETLADQGKMDAIIDDELAEIDNKFGQDRMTEIDESQSGIQVKDLIPNDPCIVVFTRRGYVKRINQSELKRQNRGTRGKRLIQIDDDDQINFIRSAMTHDEMLVVTEHGKAHSLPVYKLPDNGSKGRHIRNVIEIEGEVAASILIPEGVDAQATTLTFSTEKGFVKRTALKEYEGARRKGGITAIKLNEGDRIIGASLTTNDDHILLFDSKGNAAHFMAETVRPTGRNSAGVIGMRTDGKIISMITCDEQTYQNETAMVLTEKGYGKRTKLTEFPVKGRGGKGVIAYKENARSGPIAFAMLTNDNQDVVLLADNGVSNRVHVASVRPMGRATSGVRIVSLDEGAKLIYAAAVEHEEEGEE